MTRPFRAVAPAIAMLLIGLIALFGLPLVGAQPTPPPNPPPTLPPADGPTPTGLISLSGVNGLAERGAIRIRSGPGLSFPGVGRVRGGGRIDIIGTNGFDTARVCTPIFTDSLDMWVQVRTLDGVRGWMARCTLTITGDMSKLPVNGVPIR